MTTTIIGMDGYEYGPLNGCEGPLRLQSGRIVYYDNLEGKYYDRRKDMYLTIEEYMAEWVGSLS